MKANTASRPPNAVRRANADERPGDYREKLLTVGARLFVDNGIPNVSVEQLVRAAGISRATFYGFFENKSELAAAIIAPVFQSGLAAFAPLRGVTPGEAADGLIDVYLDLWHKYRDALLLSMNLDHAAFAYVKEPHDSFNAALRDVLANINSGGLLRTDNVDLALGVIAKTAVPLLRIYGKAAEPERLYRDSMLALLVKT